MSARLNLATLSPTVGRPRATDQRSIVEAVLAEGLADFTVTSVAKRLNITHGTLYHYYRSREELAFAAVNTVVANAQWDVTNTPWRNMLDAFAHTLWDLCESTPGFASCVLNLTHTPEGIAQIIERFVARLEKQGMKRGEAQVLIDLIGEEVLLTSMLLTKTDGPGVEVPQLEPMPESNTAAPDSQRPATIELAWAAQAGWLGQKLKLIFDGAAYQMGA